MALLERIRALFRDQPVGDEAKKAIAEAKTADDLLQQLDILATRNEMKCNELAREIDKIETQENEVSEQIRGGNLNGLGKSTALQKIQRLRKQKENYHFRWKIHNKNINMLMNLHGKVQEMEAMEMAGIEESKIDEIILKSEERSEAYEKLLAAGQVLDESRSRLSAIEERDLAELEAEIMSKAPKSIDIEEIPELPPPLPESPQKLSERPSIDELLEEVDPRPMKNSRPLELD